MTLEEFIRSMEGIGESVSSPQDIFLRVAGEFVNELQSNAPVDSGALKQNIQARVEEDSVLIQMFAYGFFQNYGVVSFGGNGRNTSQDIPETSFGAPTGLGSGGKYQFGVKDGGTPNPRAYGAYYTGLNAQRFFNIADITTRMAQRIEEELTNNINNQL